MSKPYRIWLLLTNKSHDFRLISVTLVQRLSDSREDAKVRGTQKKGGGTFSIPADPTISEPGANLSGSSHIGQVFVPLFGALAEQLFILYRIALHICMSNSFVHFSNPRGFHSVFSDFPPSSNANNCPNSNSI